MIETYGCSHQPPCDSVSLPPLLPESVAVPSSLMVPTEEAPASSPVSIPAPLSSVGSGLIPLSSPISDGAGRIVTSVATVIVAIFNLIMIGAEHARIRRDDRAEADDAAHECSRSPVGECQIVFVAIAIEVVRWKIQVERRRVRTEDNVIVAEWRFRDPRTMP